MITNKGCKRLRDLEKKVATGNGFLEIVNTYSVVSTLYPSQSVTNDKVLTLDGSYPSEYENIGCVVIYDGVEYAFDSADYPIGDSNFVNAPFVIEEISVMEDNSGHIYYTFRCNDEDVHTIEAYYTIQKETLNKTAKQIIDLIDSGIAPFVMGNQTNPDPASEESTVVIDFVMGIWYLDKNKTKGAVTISSGARYGFDSLADYPTVGYVPFSVETGQEQDGK